MASTVRTIVATGASSGLGFEAIKQLLSDPHKSYRFILGVRDTARTKASYDDLPDVESSKRQRLTILPLQLAELRSVKSFAAETLAKLEADNAKLDYLFLNAAVAKSADEPADWKSKWNEEALVNHFSQHYLIHLFRDKLVSSHGRIVVVSSGAARMVSDPTRLDKHLLAGSGANDMELYCDTKYVQLLNAHWWRRQLNGQCDVVAVSPGFIPSTGLGRHAKNRPDPNSPDAKDIPTGARSMLAALTRSDFPEDPEQIFLTSWGEWWPKDMYEKSLDKGLQDKWSPSKEEIEREAGIA